MNNKIPKLVAYLMKKYETNNPEVLADYLNVTIIRMPLEDMVAGFYKIIKRRKYIFLNTDIDDENFMRVVSAHELGHAIFHAKENCTFMGANTLLLTSKIERQANIFAAHLLITDDLLQEFSGFTQYQFCDCTGYPIELLKLKIS